jgi:hypothetical protein
MTTNATADIACYAVWADEFGSTYCWPQATKDNRHARVIVRITSREMPIDLTTLRLFSTKAEADAYTDALHARSI